MSDLRPKDQLESRGSRILLSVVVPCFNEEDVIALTYPRLMAALESREDDLEFVFVDDGSRDRTMAILSDIAADDSRVIIVSLSRNFGHQAAVTAGMRQATGDVIAVIDADLQDPPEVIPQMLAKWREGFDVVYGIRTQRKEGLLLRASYALFYRIYRGLSDTDVAIDSGDFAVIDRAVLDVINRLPEKNRFLRGLRSWVGFRQTGVIYARQSRAAGKPKYTLGKLVILAADGILNFSTVPLTIIFISGITIAGLSLVGFLFYLTQRVVGFQVFGYGPKDVQGFTSLILGLLFFGGVQLVSVGILGAYLGRIYQEVKGRPPYIVRRIISPRARETTGEHQPLESSNEIQSKVSRRTGA
jgi:glycosyltransferase involved in cell wall biosynthesis